MFVSPILVCKIVYPGKSLGYFEGKAVFTDEGLPGEVVEVESKKIKKNYIEGITKRIVQTSPKRKEPRCRHYRACSPYQIMDYEDQLELKQEQIKEIFSRQLHLELPSLEVVPSPLIWGYRQRAHFHLIWENKAPLLAYHQPGSFVEFIPVDKCFLLPEKANDYLHQVLEFLRIENLTEIKEIEIRFSFTTGDVLLVFFIDEKNSSGQRYNKTNKSKNKQEWLKIKKLFTFLPSANAVAIIRKNDHQEEYLLFGRNFLLEKIEGIFYAIGPQSFFQVNLSILARLIMDLKAFIPFSGRERLADLYCGVGTFGLALASQVAEVYGVELEPENISFLKKNLEMNQIKNFNIAAGQASKLALSVLAQGVDVIIVDPPRRGLEKKVIEAIKSYPPRFFLYLSCNPTTLARDLGQFLHVYKLKELRFYDFFPHTPHIETLAILELK